VRFHEGQHGQYAAMALRGLRQLQLHENARTWFSTVPSVTHKSCAIPAFDRPSAIRASTSRSRAVSTASGSSARWHPDIHDRRSIAGIAEETYRKHGN
jgi:hypothetical protein